MTEEEGSEAPARNGRLGAIFLTVFLDLLGFGLVMPLLPRYAETLHATPFQIGLLGAAYSGMQFLFVPVWGRLSDRVGRRPVLLVSIFGSACSMLLLGFAQRLVWLYVARLLGGLATANIATAQAYIADTTTTRTRARGMGLIGMAFGLGFVLGPLFGGWLSTISLGTPARVASALAFANLLWAWKALPESLPVHLRRKTVGRLILRMGIDPRLVRKTLTTPGLGIVIILFFMVNVSFANLEQTFALFAHDEFMLDTKGTSYIFGMVGVIAATVQGGLIGPLSRRFGETWLIRSGTLMQAVGFALVAMSVGHGLGLLYGAIAIMSMGNGLTNPSLSSLVSKRAPQDQLGQALGVMQSMGSLARVLGPTWGGFVYGLGHRLPYVTGACGLFAAWLLAYAVHRDLPAQSNA